MKRVVVNTTQRRLHPGKAKVFCVTSIITAALCFMASDLVGQDVDPFAIRAETDLVLVPTVVLKKNQVRSVSKSMSDCFGANERVFSHLSSFDPYLPKDCDNTGIPALNAKDFSVFDDGVLQNIENVSIEPNVGLTARDNLGTRNGPTRLVAYGVRRTYRERLDRAVQAIITS